MNRLNKKLEYALMTLQYFKTLPAGVKLTAKDICEVTGSPFDATARVMQLMAQNKLLVSEQGVKGGYKLQGNLADVSLLNLVEMILGPLELAKCIADPASCEIMEKCNIKYPVNRLNSKMRDFFKNMNLAEVLRDPPEAQDVRL